MSLEQNRDIDKRLPVYKVRINFNKTILYGDRSGPGVPFNFSEAVFTFAASKASIIRQLKENGGVWTVQETVWVPFDMFSSIEFTVVPR